MSLKSGACVALPAPLSLYSAHVSYSVGHVWLVAAVADSTGLGLGEEEGETPTLGTMCTHSAPVPLVETNVREMLIWDARVAQSVKFLPSAQVTSQGVLWTPCSVGSLLLRLPLPLLVHPLSFSQ